MTDPIPPPSSQGTSGRKAAVWSGVGLVVALAAGGALYVRSARAPGHAQDGHGPHDGHAHPEAAAPKRTRAVKPTASQEVLRHTDRAARAAASGDTKKARESLGEALMLAPKYAPALLVHACLALQEGNDSEAAEALERLEAEAPGSTEVALLQAMRERRRAPDAGTWQQAFRDAWLKLGRPDFRQSELLPGATPLPPDPAQVDWEKAAWARATSDDTRLRLALAARKLEAEQALFLLNQVPRLEDPDLYVAVRDALRGEALPESEYARARTVFREKLEALARAHPRSMQLQLLLLLGDTESGSELTPVEIDALEKLATLPAWRETSFHDGYVRTRELLREAGVPDASAMAMAVSKRVLGERGTWILRTRNVGTRGSLPPEGLKRLGRITRDIGASLVRQTTVVERMAGLQLVRGGAQDLGDDAGRVLAINQVEALEQAMTTFNQTAMERWPVAALTEELLVELTRDEVGYLQGFAAKAPAGTAKARP
ncbi:tetratricopeptide repeat protein [Myxococcus sp. K38C18041901]|uniref:tetratricopeptide repeat protein n=1 Tax=Myxococcus guangdongensis TaxID=2906760 RepID=UPI0020A7FF00|nr:tetratricopeptide repeat protein [Myxococcus guangdongensis]MCP3063408.1 tetratricopeptide repeat protein [Myxococcus guangdongensis]